jgi:hypothetical protein
MIRPVNWNSLRRVAGPTIAARGIGAGLRSALASPAVIRTPGALMKVRPVMRGPLGITYDALLTQALDFYAQELGEAASDPLMIELAKTQVRVLHEYQIQFRASLNTVYMVAPPRSFYATKNTNTEDLTPRPVWISSNPKEDEATAHRMRKRFGIDLERTSG